MTRRASVGLFVILVLILVSVNAAGAAFHFRHSPAGSEPAILESFTFDLEDIIEQATDWGIVETDENVPQAAEADPEAASITWTQTGNQSASGGHWEKGMMSLENTVTFEIDGLTENVVVSGNFLNKLGSTKYSQVDMVDVGTNKVIATSGKFKTGSNTATKSVSFGAYNLTSYPRKVRIVHYMPDTRCVGGSCYLSMSGVYLKYTDDGKDPLEDLNWTETSKFSTTGQVSVSKVFTLNDKVTALEVNGEFYQKWDNTKDSRVIVTDDKTKTVLADSGWFRIGSYPCNYESLNLSNYNISTPVYSVKVEYKSSGSGWIPVGMKNVHVVYPVNTSSINDTTNPVVGMPLLIPNPVTQNETINISVNVTDDVAVDKVLFSIDNGTNQTPTGNSGSLYWFTDANTSVLGNHTVDIYANDTSGNTDAVTGVIYTVVKNASDNTPPGTVTNLDETAVGYTWIMWNWTNPTDVDFNHVEIWINGTFHTNTSNPYYKATGLTQNTTYEIQTRTADDAGNVNTTWVNDTAKTAAVINDTTKPVINSVTDTPDPVNRSSLLTITANVTDDVAVDEVLVELGGKNQTAWKWVGLYYFTGADTSKVGTFNYTVYADDTSGNWATPVSGSYTVLAVPDTTPPQLTVIGPANNTIDTDARVSFKYMVNDTIGYVANCTFGVVGPVGGFAFVIPNVTEGVEQSIDHVFTSGNGNYTWSLSCTDDSGNTNSTGNYNLTINVTEGVYLSATDAGSGYINTNKVYNIDIHNLGVSDDNYTLSVSKDAGLDNATLSMSNISVGAGKDVSFTLTVRDSETGSYTTNITATSATNTSITDTKTIITELTKKSSPNPYNGGGGGTRTTQQVNETVEEPINETPVENEDEFERNVGVEMVPDVSTVEMNAGDVYEIRLYIRNLGNVQDRYGLRLAGADWIELSETSFSLTPGEMREVVMLAKPPIDSGGNFDVTVEVESMNYNGDSMVAADIGIVVNPQMAAEDETGTSPTGFATLFGGSSVLGAIIVLLIIATLAWLATPKATKQKFVKSLRSKPAPKEAAKKAPKAAAKTAPSKPVKIEKKKGPGRPRKRGRKAAK